MNRIQCLLQFDSKKYCSAKKIQPSKHQRLTDIGFLKHEFASSDYASVTPSSTPTPIRVSTRTVTTKMNKAIPHEDVCARIPLVSYASNQAGIIKACTTGVSRGTCKKNIIQQYKKKKTPAKDAMISRKRKVSFNQATIVVRTKIPLCVDGTTHTHVSKGQCTGIVRNRFRSKEVNLKIFKNGGITLTGIPTMDVAHTIIKLFQDGLKQIGYDDITFSPLQTQLINTDYGLGYRIDRKNILQVFKHVFHLNASFEPDIYQGVNTKFYWNQEYKGTEHFGYCKCPTVCKGRGDGTGIGKCKIITVAPFQTGKVLITGARNMEQIEDTYQFFNNIFRSYYAAISLNYRHNESSSPIEVAPPKCPVRRNRIHIPISHIRGYQQKKLL